MQEVTNEVHDTLDIGTASSASGQEMFAVGNNGIHTLAGIDDNSRETLEYFKQECVREFEIAMSMGVKSAKKLCAIINGIARSLGWQRQRPLWLKHSRQTVMNKNTT